MVIGNTYCKVIIFRAVLIFVLSYFLKKVLNLKLYEKFFSL